MISRILTVCVSCTLLLHSATSAPQPDPQRSVQLGGSGPRPVSLGGSPIQQGGPIYSQQLAFGPPQGSFVPIQPSPGPQQAPGRIRIAQPQPPPGFQQGGQQGQVRPYALQQFPGPSPQPQQARQQPIVLKSPSAQQQEDEYEDEEYEEEQAAPSPRPVQVRGPSRSPQPSPQAGPGPQRFVIPQQIAQQPQPTPQQINRRPVSAPRQQPAQPSYVQAQQVQPARQQQIVSQAPQQRPNGLGLDSRLKNRSTTPPPVQTINRFMRNNPDGSITWGYENEDGTFKEETLGADCVVRGKYGYVDPDGQKREYEYQQGNPCDPNKKDELEEDDDELERPTSQQKLGGILTARPNQLQQARPRPQQYYQPQ